jgi:translation initiation factor 3 subunit E
MWGKLASEILTLNWDQAVEDIQALRDAIEARANSPALALMQQRCWLMHWALFVLGNHSNGRQVVVRRRGVKPPRPPVP